MKLYLVRHTKFENPENVYPFHLPLHLSKSGKEHANKIGEWFAEKSLFHIPIYTSPIVRALETAQAIGRKTKSSVQTDVRLIETRCENLQGKKQPEIDFSKVELDDTSRESKESVLKRALSIYNEKVFENKDCVFVSHGDPLTILWLSLLKKDVPHYLWKPDNLKNTIRRGDIVEMDITDGIFESFKKYQLVENP